jgi:prophage regulatory protein
MIPKLRRVLRLPAVLEATGYSRSQLQEKITKGEFPAPFKLSESGRAKGWFEDAVIDWQHSRTSEARAQRGLVSTVPRDDARDEVDVVEKEA